MKQLLLFPSFLLLLFVTSCTSENKDFVKDIPLNDDWQFCLLDSANASSNDTKWQTVDIPHDFSIEQPFSESNPSHTGGGYAFGGVGLYKKQFTINEKYKSQKVTIYFDGVYRNSQVWINGHLLGERPYGYVPFQYDLTTYIKFGDIENTIEVKVNTANQPNSRWYTGAGIYRKVKLHISDHTHIIPNGVFATTIELNTKRAVITINTEIYADSSTSVMDVVTLLKDSNGTIVGEAVTSDFSINKDTSFCKQELILDNPQLWSPKNPHLYTLTTEVYQDHNLLDSYSTLYGVRTIEFSPNKGLLVNGEPIKLKGVNNHHDGGPLGSACYDRTFERQIELLKSMGCNAIRMSHNPPASPLLDYADKMGMLVIDEIFDEWEYGKREHGYSPHFKEWCAKDIEDWIRRDRNHASIIAWSLGNEIPEQSNPKGAANFKLLKKATTQFDTTRPFTAACNEIPNGNKHGYTEAMDIVGYNYREPHYAEDHETYPDRVIYGSETTIYPYQPGPSFPLHSYQDWYLGQTAAYVAGEFLWTGFDYIGEAGIGQGGTDLEPWNTWPQWPYRSADCGVIDLCGNPKPGYFFRKSLWTEKPMVYMAVETDASAQNPQAVPFWGWAAVQPHWNHSTPGDSLAVHIYTNCEEVELFLNDKSLGKHKHDLSKEAFIFTKVAYQAGSLKAVGYTSNGDTTQFELQTASQASNIVLTPDRTTINANNEDLCYATVELRDANNNPVLFDNRTIDFQLKGEGKIIAIGNGNPQSLTPFKGTTMETYLGKCLVVIKSGNTSGQATLTATSEELQSATVELTIMK